MRRALVGIAVVALAISCGEDVETRGSGSGASGGSGGTGGSGGVISGNEVATWCDAVVEPFCEALFACCNDPSGVGYGDSLAACIEDFGGDCNSTLGEELDPLLQAGKSQLDGQRMSACVSKLEAMTAGGSACSEAPSYVLLECLAAFEGQVEAGGSCDGNDNSYVECNKGLCFNGVCESFLASGESCTPDSDTAFCDFTAGEWCIEGANGSSCGPRLAEGQACGTAGPGEDLQCLSLVCENGQCQPADQAALCTTL